MHYFDIEGFFKLNSDEVFVIAGPCVIESRDLLFNICDNLLNITTKHNIKLIFKASFDKANRTSINSYRGPGIEKGLKILRDIKERFNIPITTDIHESYQADMVKDIIDIIQIPAFLCRQTDLLISAGKTKKVVNIKKGQFLSASDMKYAVEKVMSTDNNKVMLTERGNIFGYNNLIVDIRNIIDMKKLNIPVVIDATHSVQKPGGGSISGGNREYAPYIALMSAAVGVNIFFFEVHPDPDNALSDGPNMITPETLNKLIPYLKKIKNTIPTNYSFL